MPSICPRPCSRLATAAVFISVGVVQFIVGMILLRSKYVYLLAGPDFWTATSNVVAGSLLGISASVWKSKKGKFSTKHVVRRNVLAALMMSALVINATTAALLILGEGNTLLSIQLENTANHNTLPSFAGEILGYAYAASVCSPIVCVVIAIVFLAGNCFYFSDIKPVQYETPKTIVKKEYPDLHQWVYTPAKTNYDCPQDYDSTSSEDTPLPCNDDDELIDALYACALYKMAKARRSRSFSNETMYQQRKKNLRKSHSQKTSKVSFSDNLSNERRFQKNSRSTQRSNKPRHSRERNSNSSGFSNDALERQSYAENEVFYEDPVKIKPENLQSKHLAYTRYQNQTEDDSLSEVIADVHVSEGSSSRISSKKHGHYVHNNAESNNSNNYDEIIPTSTLHPTASRTKSSSDFSDVSDSTFDAYRVSLAGDLVPIQVSSGAKMCQRLIPVAIPVVPNSFELTSLNSSMDVKTTAKRKSEIEESSISDRTNVNDLRLNSEANFSSFREDVKEESQNSDDIKIPCKKRQRRLSSMTTIPEIYVEEVESNAEQANSAPSSGYASEDMIHSAEDSEELCRGTKEVESHGAAVQEEEVPENESITAKRVLNSSPKNYFRKFWYSGGKDLKVNILDQIVDDDCLIGLSEQELVLRQLRNRSLRKIVEKRMREKSSSCNSEETELK